MKFAAAVTILCCLAKSATGEVMKAFVHTKCDGVETLKLTDAEKQFSAEALTLAYNQVHQVYDNGDKYLVDVHWDDHPEMHEFFNIDDR